jgi:cytochrome c-type biogenesis protein CcmE
VKIYYFLAGVIVAGLAVFGYSSLSRSFTPYLETFAEVRASDRPYVKVPGMLVSACKFDEKSGAFVFEMRDTKGERMKVSYKGQKPFNFEQAKWVVVGGRYRDGVFEASNVSTKCPSKYGSRQGD